MPLSFDYRITGLGAELECSDGRTRFLQGEDAEPIESLDKWIDATEFPFGPYETVQDAIDTILEEYFQ